VSVDAFPTWLPVDTEPEQPVDVFALLPAHAGDRLDELYAQLWDRGVDDTTLELCRARITTMVTGAPIQPGETAAPPETDAQHAAVGFAEQFVLDPHGCTDEQMRALQTHFTGPQLATLTTAIAVFDALARVRAVLAAPEEGSP
jgi:alkylhydroperoxidase family enzyme